MYLVFELVAYACDQIIRNLGMNVIIDMEIFVFFGAKAAWSMGNNNFSVVVDVAHIF